VDAARERIVVLDTAPTGHTLLLLDAAQSYHREVQRTTAQVPGPAGASGRRDRSHRANQPPFEQKHLAGRLQPQPPTGSASLLELAGVTPVCNRH
jgi:anion-transporting  ArsA/GET3 family ATPase